MSGTHPIRFDGDGVIDAHMHVGSWLFEIEGNGSLASLERIAKDHGISRCVVMASNPESIGSSRANRALIDETWTNDRFIPFYWLDPRTDSVDDLNRYKTKIWGVKLHPSHTKTRIDDPKMEPFLRWCEREQMPLLVHCGRWQQFSSHIYAIDVARRYTFPLILAHMGGPAYDLKTAALESLRKDAPPNVYLDTSTCFQPYLIRKSVETIGESRILFGSDYPLYHPALGIQTVLLAGFPARVTSQILGDNTSRLLNVAGRRRQL